MVNKQENCATKHFNSTSDASSRQLALKCWEKIKAKGRSGMESGGYRTITEDKHSAGGSEEAEEQR